MRVNLNLNANKQLKYRKYQTQTIQNNKQAFGIARPSDGDYEAADWYNRKLLDYIRKSKLVAALGENFKTQLLIPVEEYLKKEGVYIETKLTRTPPKNSNLLYTAGMELYEAFPLISAESRGLSPIKNAASSADIISLLEPDSFVDYTPNLAKSLLLDKLSPTIKDEGIVEKIKLMRETVASIDKAIRYEDPRGIYPQDLQYVFEHLIPAN